MTIDFPIFIGTNSNVSSSFFHFIPVGISMIPINSNYCKVVEFHRVNGVHVHVDFSIADSHVMVTIAIETVVACEMIMVIVVANEDQHQHHPPPPLPTKVISITKSKIMKTIQKIRRSLGADQIVIANQNQRPTTKIN